LLKLLLSGTGAGLLLGCSNVRLGVLSGAGVLAGLLLGAVAGVVGRLSGLLNIRLGVLLLLLLGLLSLSSLLMVLPGWPGCVALLLGAGLIRRLLSLILLGALSASGRRSCSPCGLKIRSWLFDRELPGRSLSTTLTGLTSERVTRDTSLASGP
jgi:hypothetical protein